MGETVQTPAAPQADAPPTPTLQAPETPTVQADAPARPKSRFARFRVWIRRYFWLWVAYQAVKGITTTTVIWIPLLLLWLKRD